MLWAHDATPKLVEIERELQHIKLWFTLDINSAEWSVVSHAFLYCIHVCQTEQVRCGVTLFRVSLAHRSMHRKKANEKKKVTLFSNASRVSFIQAYDRGIFFVAALHRLVITGQSWIWAEAWEFNHQHALQSIYYSIIIYAMYTFLFICTIIILLHIERNI